MRCCINMPNFGDYHDPDTVAGLAVRRSRLVAEPPLRGLVSDVLNR